MRVRESVSFWQENEKATIILLQVCVNSVVVKTSPRNIGDLVFLESQKAYSINSLLTKSKTKLPRIYLSTWLKT